MDRLLPKYVYRKPGGLYLAKRGMCSVKLPCQFAPGSEDIAQIKEAAARILRGDTNIRIIDAGANGRFLQTMERGAQKRAKAALRPFDLPSGWIDRQFRKQGGLCAISGLEMFRDRLKHAPFAPSIDRKNHRLGYTEANCHLVCYIVNCAKNQFTMHELVTMCRAVAAHQEQNGDGTGMSPTSMAVSPQQLPIFANPLKTHEASIGIEPIFTDLQSNAHD